MKARYIRVSTASQNNARQLAKSYPDEKLYIDVVSGSVPFTNRDQCKELIEEIQTGKIDYISVSSIDRLGRNLYDILTTLNFLNENRITLKVDNLGIESLVDGKENSAFKLIISVIGNIAEMERDSILERQREGINIAIAQGKYKGRVKGTTESNTDFLLRYKDVVKYLKQKQSIRNTAKLCEVSPATVQKVANLIKSTS